LGFRGTAEDPFGKEFQATGAYVQVAVPVCCWCEFLCAAGVSSITHESIQSRPPFPLDYTQSAGYCKGVVEKTKRPLAGVLGGGKGKKKVATKIKASTDGNALKGKLRHGQGIYANYKGTSYRAVFYKTRGIKLNGKFYETPTGAAKAIVDRGTVNGWSFWKYKDGEVQREVKSKKAKGKREPR